MKNYFHTCLWVYLVQPMERMNLILPQVLNDEKGQRANTLRRTSAPVSRSNMVRALLIASSNHFPHSSSAAYGKSEARFDGRDLFLWQDVSSHTAERENVHAYRHESSDWSLARFTRLAKLHDQSTSAGYLVTSARVNPSHAVEILIAVCRLQLRRQVAQLIIC